jgi:hypothetical protein
MEPYRLGEAARISRLLVERLFLFDKSPPPMYVMANLLSGCVAAGETGVSIIPVVKGGGND